MAKRRKPNFLYAIISVTLVLFLLGFFAISLLFAQQQAKIQQNEASIMVEIKETADSSARAALHEWLNKADFVERAVFISKEEAAQEMRRWLGSDIFDGSDVLPLFESYRVLPKQNMLDNSSLDNIQNQIREQSAVRDVFYDAGDMQDIAKNIEKIAAIALAIAFLFVIVSITLIHNTIRLTLYSDRFIIRNMQLVGATWQFITRPYIRKSIRNGIFAAILALGALGGLWFYIQKGFPDLNILLSNPVFWLTIGSIFLLGIVISWISTYYVVSKYLKMRLDDLY